MYYYMPFVFSLIGSYFFLKKYKLSNKLMIYMQILFISVMSTFLYMISHDISHMYELVSINKISDLLIFSTLTSLFIFIIHLLINNNRIKGS
ncbi:hypothetical protein BI323_04945 [Yersinia ruckeri]|uniref:Uncharacterized protein n=1 Tax=Yersinia ruckeri TaxID=29486 RepID=A0A380QR77_YERRU|nr:putative membrane protein [Yersinia ruckeri ATCC 29473]OEU24842.1 hypothetical protein BI323_04945 [Yersinia ruckeri]PHZ19862.1 hypothetical protein CS534_08090 [Yersinia ruckeri]QTD78011.1 Putative membrane protein [Yersinia ruckeri]CNI01778.1 Uncharacterised protein [Yersinia ruckeri]